MQPIYDWFRQLYETTGIDLIFIYDAFDRARMIRGFWLTVELSVVTIVLGLVIGVIGAWLQRSHFAWLRRIIVDQHRELLALNGHYRPVACPQRYSGNAKISRVSRCFEVLSKERAKPWGTLTSPTPCAGARANSQKTCKAMARS